MGGRYRWVVLSLCTFTLFVTVFARLAISPVVPNVINEFGVTNTQIGLALTFMWVGYAVTQYPSGVLADKFGDRSIILVSVGGTGLISIVIAGAPSFLVFGLGAVLLGAVAGLHYSVATALINRTFEEVGTAIGIHNGGAPLAGVLTPIVITAVAVEAGWRPALLVSSIVALPVFLGVVAWIRPSAPRRPDEPVRGNFHGGRVRELWSRPPVLFTGVIAIISDFTWQAIASFLPSFFVQYHGLRPADAAILFGTYFVALGLLQIPVGNLSDRYGYDAAILLCMVAGIVGFVFLVNGEGFPVLVLAVTLVGLGMGFGGAVFPRFLDQVPPEEQATDFGMFRTSYMLVAALGPVVIGYLSDHYGWEIALGSLATVLGVSGLMVVVNYLLGTEL